MPMNSSNFNVSLPFGNSITWPCGVLELVICWELPPWAFWIKLFEDPPGLFFYFWDMPGLLSSLIYSSLDLASLFSLPRILLWLLLLAPPMPLSLICIWPLSLLLYYKWLCLRGLLFIMSWFLPLLTLLLLFVLSYVGLKFIKWLFGPAYYPFTLEPEIPLSLLLYWFCTLLPVLLLTCRFWWKFELFECWWLEPSPVYLFLFMSFILYCPPLEYKLFYAP